MARRETHSAGVGPVPRVVGVILCRGGRVLLQRRDALPTIPWPDHWAIFGGGMEPGEAPEACARRELMEELELILAAPLVPVARRVDSRLDRTFYAAVLPCEPEALTLHEGQAMRLFTVDEIRTWPLVPLHREVLLEYLSTAGD